MQKIGLAVWAGTLCALSVQAAPKETAERAARAQIAASTLADAVVVDCQLPGRLVALGGMRNYLSPGVLTRLAAIDCRTRGGEYTVGDLASGTLSLARWLPLAEKGDLEAEYYVARIYANGMDNVPMDYSKAADWYQRAAHKKYAPAMQELGYLYEQGLGVQQDPLAGLNLQREASGLGEDLDYAWKIAATREQADRQIAALTEDLAGTNSVVRDLRTELQVRDARLLQGRAQLAKDRQQLAQLRLGLEQAVSVSGGSSASAARIQELQQKLATDESALTDKQREIDELSASLSTQQAQMAGQLAKSQATNSKLNELLASGRDANEGLRANTAQMELRLNQAEAELSMLRTSYLQETNELAARSEELQQLREHGGDAAQALLAARQRELDQQRSRIKSLESQLAAAGTQGAEAGSSSKQALAHNQELEKSLAALRAQYDQQQQDLQAQRAQVQRLQSQAREDKQSRDEKSPLMAQLSTGLAAKTQDLEEQQRRVTAMRAEADRLRDEYARAREASDKKAATVSGQEQQVREALRLAQEKIAKQNDRMEHLEVEVAARKLELVKLRESLAREAAGNELANRKRTAALEAEVREKDKQLSAVRVEIARSGEPKAPSPVVANLNTRGPRDTVGTPEPDELLRMVRRLGPAKYHALVIGNSHYQLMSGLKTPVSDARDVADVLGSHYGFDVKLLTDVTRDQIMAAMNEYARTLTDADRLLIYYAGHGGTKIFPPERAFWLGVDADPELPSSWLSAQTVADAIWQIHARHILLVADSCFSSVITHPTSTTLVRTDDEHVTAIRWNKAARMVLTSGQNEPVVDGTSADATHSLFAELFITVLRQNSILLSGNVLAHELTSRIQDYARRTGLKQTPTYSNLQDPQHKFGDFFFVPLAIPVQVASRQ
ncbi:MAG: peptidase caspase catalytic subunit p20 [Gammaproteobacteria bacterium]|nr:peptidase caspase catalytic subunit p20 [Gammaproteobacteria bacterium]